MDSYTSDVKAWLNKRFRETTREGVYLAHQPIYGFRKGYCEPGCLDRYLITHEVLKVISEIKGDSFLDVGGAEGYKAALVHRCFEIKVRNSDLSGEACRRAEEIFQVQSDETDSHGLPYEDGAFDIVLSSESIEHVNEYESVVEELLRVAANCVIITVPHEPPELVRRNIEQKVVHGHIHAFNTETFAYLKSRGLEVEARRILHPLILRISAFIEGVRKPVPAGRSKAPYVVFNALVPVFKMLLGKRAAAFAMNLDSVLCRISGRHCGLVFVITKNGSASLLDRSRKVRPMDVLDFEVPLYYYKRPISD